MRYNLAAKVASAAKGKAREEDAEPGKDDRASGWASTKAERATLMQRRREEMILRARRKMEERIAEGLE
jgi:coupling of ubiquitin conjugation to ER degradation protein 1